MVAGADRARTAVGWALAVVVVGVVYLHPSLAAPSQPGPAATSGRPLFAVANSPATVVDSRFIDGLLRSTDGGAHWEQVRLPAPSGR